MSGSDKNLFGDEVVDDGGLIKLQGSVERSSIATETKAERSNAKI